MEVRSFGPDRHRVHKSLIRRPLFFGLEMRYMLLEVCLTGALAFALGLSISTLVLVAVVVFGLHRALVYATARDRDALDFLVQALFYDGYYRPQAAPEEQGGASVPTSCTPTAS